MLETYQQSDLDKLAELHQERDPRSIEEMIAEDESVDVEIEKARLTTYGGKRAYEVTMDGSLVTLFTVPDDFEIKAGDTLTLYQPGASLFGGMRHGFAINGKVIEWKTPWERYAERIAMLAQHDRHRRERITRDRPVIEGWYAQLHGPYKARIDRFRAERADFDVDSGTYEIYPVLMGQRIEAWARDTAKVEGTVDREDAVKVIEQFRELPHDEQSKVIHAGEQDAYGISGHQFDSACGLAVGVLMGQDV